MTLRQWKIISFKQNKVGSVLGKWDICENYYTYTDKARFKRHMESVHIHSEVLFTQSDIKQMNNSESEDIRYGLETLRRKTLIKYKLRPKNFK